MNVNVTRYIYGPGGLPIEDQQPDTSFRGRGPSCDSGTCTPDVTIGCGVTFTGTAARITHAPASTGPRPWYSTYVRPPWFSWSRAATCGRTLGGARGRPGQNLCKWLRGQPFAGCIALRCMSRSGWSAPSWMSPPPELRSHLMLSRVLLNRFERRTVRAAVPVRALGTRALCVPVTTRPGGHSRSLAVNRNALPPGARCSDLHHGVG
jgi:hypothetical protein